MHAVGSEKCAVCSVKCAVCSVQCAVCSVQCSVCSVQCEACTAMVTGDPATWWQSRKSLDKDFMMNLYQCVTLKCNTRV